MKLIVGLGNPGLRYKKTKHNAGYWAIDSIAEQEAITLNKRKFNAQWAKAEYRGKKFIITKPLTFMNLSGNSVKSFVDYFKIDCKDLLVIYDDINLKLGHIRLKPSGGAGGHNGLISVIECLGTNNFARLRLGINTKDKITDLSAYVLSNFKHKQDYQLAKEAVENSKQAAFCWLDKGIVLAMNRFNNKKEEGSKYE